MRRIGMIGFFVFVGAVLSASVPNRITYQGRLFKSGVAVSGPKVIRLALVHPTTFVELESEVFNVTLPGTGEFTIVWDSTLDPGFDWRGVNPQLKITVDGEALSPNELLGVSPYSFVARKVEVGGVDTAALADGAVTNAKVAVGVEAAKILVSTSPGNTYLSDWRHPVSKDKIDASKIEGTIPTIPSAHGASHGAGGSDALVNLSRTQVAGTALVANSTFTQVLQAVSVSTAVLAVKGVPGSASKIIQIYDSGVLGNTGSLPVEQAWFDKDANLVTNKGIMAAGAIGANALSAVSANITTVTAGTMTVTGNTALGGNLTTTGSSTFNRTTASSMTVAGPLNVTGTTALGSFTAGSGNVANLTVDAINVTEFPVFSAYRQTNQAGFGPNFNLAIVFDRKAFDSHNFFNTTNGRFLPTIPGYYHLMVSVVGSLAINGGGFIPAIFKNNAPLINGTHYMAHPQANGLASALVYADGDDYFDVRLYTSAAGNAHGGETNTVFSGYRVK